MEQSKRAQCDAKSISTISVQCCFALEQKKSFMAEKKREWSASLSHHLNAHTKEMRKLGIYPLRWQDDD